MDACLWPSEGADELIDDIDSGLLMSLSSDSVLNIEEAAVALER